MIKSVLVRSCCTPLLVEAKDFRRSSSSNRVFSRITSGSSSSSSGWRSSGCIPKLEPFSRTKLERVIKDPPLIKKSEIEISDYCSTLEGDDSYSCWRAYFELKELEGRTPKEDVERLILQTGGVKSLIGCLHGISTMHKGDSNTFSSAAPLSVEKERERSCPVPDGLPMSLEELEEQERARMPDSPYTRLLRTKGRLPAWFSPVPDHETD